MKAKGLEVRVQIRKNSGPLTVDGVSETDEVNGRLWPQPLVWERESQIVPGTDVVLRKNARDRVRLAPRHRGATTSRPVSRHPRSNNERTPRHNSQTDVPGNWTNGTGDTPSFVQKSQNLKERRHSEYRGITRRGPTRQRGLICQHSVETVRRRESITSSIIVGGNGWHPLLVRWSYLRTCNTWIH